MMQIPIYKHLIIFFIILKVNYEIQQRNPLKMSHVLKWFGTDQILKRFYFNLFQIEFQSVSLNEHLQNIFHI